MDLVLPARSSMCAIAMSDDFLLTQLKGFACLAALETIERFNVLANSSTSCNLLDVLRKCWDVSNLLSSDLLESEIITTLIQCLIDPNGRKVARAPTRNARHNAALKVMSLAFNEPNKPFEIQDLSNLLHQSRTSLFSGCKEKFGMSPVQVVRSVRMHQVRHALLDVEFSEKYNF